MTDKQDVEHHDTDDRSPRCEGLRIEVRPPDVIPFMDDREREKRVALLDIRIDKEPESLLRVDLDVAFRCIPISRGLIQKRDYYIGTTGGQVDVSLSGSRVRENTESVKIDVKYTNEVSRPRHSSLQISPSISAKSGSSSVEAKFGAVTFNETDEEKYVTSFENAEHQLAATRLNDRVSWKLDVPKGSKVIRAFLLGNLHLYATFASPNEDYHGAVELRPSDISFFDSSKQPIDGRKQTITMLFAVWRNGHRIPSKHPTKIKFRSMRDE